MERELRRTRAGMFSFRVWEDESIVRNYAKISACLPNWKYLVGPYGDFLAKPVFTGNAIDEEVLWKTAAFTTSPVLLSSLQEEEYAAYKKVLNENLCAFREAIDREPSSLRKAMFESALAYISEDKIYCADGKVVVVEWGMYPKDTHPVDMISTYLPAGKRYKEQHNEKVQKEDPEDKSATEEKDEPERSENAMTTKQAEQRNSLPLAKSPEKITSDDAGEDGKSVFQENQEITPSWNMPQEKFRKEEGGSSGEKEIHPDKQEGIASMGGSSFDRPFPEPDKLPERKEVPGWKKWLAKWWWLLLLLLFLLLGAIFFPKCSGGGGNPLQGIPTVMPPVTPGDVVTSPDSLTQEVSDRLNIVIRKGGGVSDFITAFRRVYPDEQRYQLIYYDTLIPRVQIKMPREEKEQMKEELRERLPEFELSIVPESIFRHHYVSDDPALQDQKKRWYFDFCKVFQAWDISQGSPEIIVAIVDDGFDLNHPELKGKYLKPYNAATHTAWVTPSAKGHGTHVAATAVGIAGNAAGTSGIAPRCRLMPVQVANEEGIMSTTAVIDGVLYAITQGADVVNLSLGMQFGPLLQYMPIGFQRDLIANNFLEEEQLWNDIFSMADEHHCTLVLAAGNENVLAGIEPMQRNLLGIKVSAVQPDRAKADFSNYGDFSTLSAPGVAIYNAVPGGRYTYMNGTSMAAPIVTGAVALMKSLDRQLSTSEIVGILEQTGLYSSSPVGRIIQLDRALASVLGGTNQQVPGQPGTPVAPPRAGEDCETVRQKIRQLMEEIEQLKKTHPGCWQAPDTLKLPEVIDLNLLQGRWQSTQPLHSSRDLKVILYFDFFGTNKGNILVVEEDHTVYTATTTLSVEGNKLFISQDAEARSKDNASIYNPYDFVCRPNKEGLAECRGVNKRVAANKVNFKLIKIN